MKTTLKISLLIVAVVGSMTFQSCKGKKKDQETAKPADEVLVNVYCSGPEFFSDKKNFRANSVGESMDQQTSKKKSLTQAKADLASFIETTIKATYDNYVNSREYNNKEELEEKFEGLAREVVKQKLSGIKVICEKVTKTKENRYKTYIAIELSGKDLIEAINERMTKNESLKIDYDYEKFKKTFDDEMEKLEKERP